MKLVIATRNKHKLEEIKAIFDFAGLEVVSALDYPEIPEVVEDGQTFEANAIKKAFTLAMKTGTWALADDSGLEVDALNGAPGIYSARYAGEPVDYDANNKKLLRELKEKNDRKARFRCVMALSSPRGRAQVVEGVCEGHIIDEERGDKGFGYDPVFIPEGHERTFAEMAADEKNSMSHRARALTRAVEVWGQLLADLPEDWPDSSARSVGSV